jgi:hypothetical protein
LQWVVSDWEHLVAAETRILVDQADAKERFRRWVCRRDHLTTIILVHKALMMPYARGIGLVFPNIELLLSEKRPFI